MNFGNIEGLVSGVESVVFDYEVTGSAVSSISTGNILNGDEDGWYTVIGRMINTSTASNLIMRFNGDSGTNYGIRGIDASNTTVSDISATGYIGHYLCAAGASESVGMFVARFYAKSGAVRLVNAQRVEYINGTAVSRIRMAGSVWSNTADNIINAVFAADVGNGLGVGTRIIILKSNNFTNGTPTGVINTPYIKGAWVEVGSSVLGGEASSVTFDNLDGDRDVLYRLTYESKAGTGAIGTIKIELNNDTGTNYGYQYLYAINTAVAATRSSAAYLYGSVGNTAGDLSSMDLLLFAKQGFVRPAIQTFTGVVSGTTVTLLGTMGSVYSVTNTNITKMKISQTNFAAGSQFKLMALRPNG